ncbi:single-stranded-DNA-specific exonuclease RecJ [Eubacterium oxidoreducens]|uniref:Single-stranded-DNA-specific exonuclease RecJ n=1 Tax=Eubacterium oxidoreducens TaxID=1732 RepID=A0A1G6C009_EUBOX|nr:single-stranded-DNA-specific exonuclease RecJ [Eubacterium oxidoreducens]SDB26223.1 single-stranded-DNA-specific exonuclease [Eubacterium oxidoreducens]
MKVDKTWIGQMKRADFTAIAKRFGIDPVTARIIRNKDIVTDEEIDRYLNASKEDLYHPALMKDIGLAAGILQCNIKEQKHIRIIGDYDADGINATYILYKALSDLGAQVSWDIPHRIHDGYGINVRMVEKADKDGADTIITCDNGIAAREAITRAKELGMTIIVTDHHEPPLDEDGQQIIYEADALIDPKQDACNYPYKDLCGAAVAYKLMCYLYEQMGRDAEQMDDLLENVGIATITDVMPLTGENRILVKEGLKRLAHPRNPGIKALMYQLGIEPEGIRPYHIGFEIGPCLNATGRIDSASRAMQLLLTQEANVAGTIAAELVDLNTQRKEMTRQGELQAIEYVEEHFDEHTQVFIIYLPQCHESIAGIIAGHVKERYHRPTIVLTDAKACIKGSGRSIEEYNMFEGINECKETLLKFGGHPLAAGISLAPEQLAEFTKRINEKAQLTKEDLKKKYYIDVPMPFSYVTLNLVREFSVLEPFGKDNERPLFMQKDAQIVSARVFGEKKNVLKLMAVTPEGNGRYELIAFADQAKRFMEYMDEKFGENTFENMLKGQCMQVVSFVYRPKINTYRGRDSIQFEIVDFL